MMVTHRGFSAWICSGGENLNEYEIVVDSTANKVSCWVPCKTGKEFSVFWEDHGSEVDSAGFIILDGFTIPGQFLYGSGIASRSGARVSQDKGRPFVFSKVHFGQANTSKDLGTIVLKIKQIRRGELTHEPNAYLAPPTTSKTRRSAGVQAVVGYGSPQKTDVQHPKTWVCEPFDNTQPGSYVTFIFRYRPAESLINQGIMPEDSMVWEKSDQASVLTLAGSLRHKERRLLDMVCPIGTEFILPPLDPEPSYPAHSGGHTWRSDGSFLPHLSNLPSPYSSGSTGPLLVLPPSSPRLQAERPSVVTAPPSFPQRASGEYYREHVFEYTQPTRGYVSYRDSRAAGMPKIGGAHHRG